MDATTTTPPIKFATPEEFPSLFQYELLTNDDGEKVLRTSKQKFIQRVTNNRLYRAGDEMVGYSVLTEKQKKLKSDVQTKLRNPSNPQESRALACMLGMAVGDALGHTLEFMPVRYDYNYLVNMMVGGGKFQLRPGQWTDDTSMGLCLADSLLACDEHPSFGIDPYDLMLRFEMWWNCGYNNAFAFDEIRENKHSVGLGGNISKSLQRFLYYGEPFTHAGDKNTSGNGGLMRLAAVPTMYFRTPKLCMDVAEKQCLVTHQGLEAADCARLQAYICSYAMLNPTLSAKEVLDNCGETFTAKTKSVMYLARGEPEPSGDPDRNWNWKNTNHRYAPSRAKMQPGYVGSYAMDGLSMALHCIYCTDSFENAVLKAINLCGDADTVGAIAGQIAGTIYGIENIPEDWISDIQEWDRGGDIALKAYLLYKLKESNIIHEVLV